MKKIILVSLMTLFCASTQAQEQRQVRERAIGKSFIYGASKINKNTFALSNTENNSWHENIGILDNVPVEKDISDIFPYSVFKKSPKSIPVKSWRLTDEGQNTVLHCYLKMATDNITNIWLCNEECVILDKETGIIYQSKSTIPEQCYNKVFSVRGKKGTTIDLKILFPKLPANAKDLAIYGVPGWGMRGMNIKGNSLRTADTSEEKYDSIPIFHMAHLVKKSVDYDKNNMESWAVYKDAHLIKPVKEKTMAIWRTPNTTYLAIATEQNWMREYYGRGGKTILVDPEGHQYKCKGVMGYPNDNVFWLEGYPGDYFAIVLMFEPLPLNINNFAYVSPEGKPFNAWGADWSGEVISNLEVSTLRENQRLFKYHQRDIVK